MEVLRWHILRVQHGDLVRFGDLYHFGSRIRIDKGLLGQRKTLALSLGLLCEIVGAPGTLATTRASRRGRAAFCDRRAEHRDGLPFEGGQTVLGVYDKTNAKSESSRHVGPSVMWTGTRAAEVEDEKLPGEDWWKE